MGDLCFDILRQLKEDVAHLPRRQRREAFLERAREVAQEFLNTAKRYDLSGDDSSDTENKESSDNDNGPAGLVPPPKAQRRG